MKIVISTFAMAIALAVTGPALQDQHVFREEDVSSSSLRLGHGCTCICI